MTLAVCFDVLHTCFSLEPLVEALDASLGDDLRAAGQGARGVVMDWFHSAQRDYAMLTTINHPSPPPPIAQILRLTLPRSIHFALNGTSPGHSVQSPLLHSSSHSSSQQGQAPPLSNDTHLLPTLNALSSLTPSATLSTAWSLLHKAGHKVILVTNGAEPATRAYAEKAGLGGLVDEVISCDAVGRGKPDGKVYDVAWERCAEVMGRKGGEGDSEEGVDGVKSENRVERWFVACHTWDVAAARKKGFKTGLVLSEQPPMGEEEHKAFWGLYGGEPDVVGRDLEEVVKGVMGYTKQVE